MSPSVFLIGSLLCASLSAYQINFTASDREILSGLTPDLTLTCAVTTNDVTGLVGRDVTDAVVLVTSLVVTRDLGASWEDVASIMDTFPAKAMSDHHLLNVSGHLFQARGQLTLTWKTPSDHQAAVYTCEVNAMTSQGHHVQFSKSLRITAKSPELTDLVKIIQNYNQGITDLQNGIGVLKQENLERQTEIKALNSTLAKQQVDMLEFGHVESGTVDCGNDVSWSSLDQVYGYSSKFTEVRQSFSKPYSQAPVVKVSVENLYHFNSFFWVYLYTTLTSVDATGFVLRCGSQYGDNRVRGLKVSWISLPTQ